MHCTGASARHARFSRCGEESPKRARAIGAEMAEARIRPLARPGDPGARWRVTGFSVSSCAWSARNRRGARCETVWKA